MKWQLCGPDPVPHPYRRDTVHFLLLSHRLVFGLPFRSRINLCRLWRTARAKGWKRWHPASKEFQSFLEGKVTLVKEAFSFCERKAYKEKAISLSGERLYLIISLRFHPPQFFLAPNWKRPAFLRRKSQGEHTFVTGCEGQRWENSGQVAPCLLWPFCNDQLEIRT